MTAKSADHDELRAAAALRRLVEAHHSGRLPTALYRERRRNLLQAITRGDPIPEQFLPSTGTALWSRIGWVAVVVLVLFALGWWFYR